MLSYGKLEFLTGSAWLFPPPFSPTPCTNLPTILQSKVSFCRFGAASFWPDYKNMPRIIIVTWAGEKGEQGKGLPFWPGQLICQLNWPTDLPRFLDNDVARQCLCVFAS